jgi:pyrimidine-nucleoside phosphorylase
MVEIGEAAGKKTIALVTDMDEPLGNAVGNTLEVAEAVETLRGGGPQDLREVCVELAAYMLLRAGKADDLRTCRDKAETALRDGSALGCLVRMVEAQGGDSSYIREPGRFPLSPIIQPLVAEQTGYIQAVDARAIGNASVILGAGRLRKEDPVDYRAGLVMKKKTGGWVAAGDTLAELHTSAFDACTEAMALLRCAFAIGDAAPPAPKLFHARVSAAGIDML